MNLSIHTALHSATLFGLCLISKIIVFWTCNTLPILTMWSPSLVGSLLLLSWVCSLLRLHPPQGRSFATFCLFHSDSWHFCLSSPSLLLLFLIEAQIQVPAERDRLCPLNAVCHVASKSGLRYIYHVVYPRDSVSQGRSPPWFWHSKGYFTHAFLLYFSVRDTASLNSTRP